MEELLFHKLKYNCHEASHAFHKVSFRFAPKIEPLINTTDVCFHKLQDICYEANHVFHKLSIRFELLINTTRIWKTYVSVWLFP